MPSSDVELVMRSLTGDLDAFGQLATRYQGAVFGLAFHLLGNVPDAQDATQEAFVKAFQYLHQLEQPDKFAGWLKQIAANTCHRLVRRAKRELAKHDAWTVLRQMSPANHQESLEQQIVHEEMTQIVQHALSNLSERDRLVLTLYYMDGLSHREIGEFLSLPVSTIKSRLHHARDRLKEEIRMVEKAFTQMRPTEDFTEFIRYLKRAAPNAVEMQGVVTEVERVEGPHYMPTRWKIALENGCVIQAKRVEDEPAFRCEKYLLELLMEEHFPVPRLYSTDDSERVLFTDHVEGQSLTGLAEADLPLQPHLSAAAEHLARLEAIHLRHKQELLDFLPEQQRQLHSRSLDEVRQGTTDWLFQQLETLCGRNLTRSELAQGQSLLDEMVRDIHTGRDILGIWEVFPISTLITDTGLRHTWLLSHVGHLARESRFVWLFTTPLFWRGGAYRFFADEASVESYLSVSHELGYELDPDQFRRCIDAQHFYWFCQNYLWLVEQANEPEKDTRTLEWARQHGMPRERLVAHKRSFLESLLLSDDSSYHMLRQLLM